MSRATAFLTLTVLALLLAPSADAQWSSKPGETKRNAFGPLRGDKASVCRGACGAGCPDTCVEQVTYECTGPESLRRITTYECGTHRGCRTHDDCLDACSQNGIDKLECQARCHQQAVDIYGFEDATSWARGNGPYDTSPVTFEYTREGPTMPEPVFRCPEGARVVCEGIAGRCVAAGGARVEPVFDSYSAGGGGMSISGLRAGRMCGGRVCEETSDIRVTGADSCAQSGGAVSCTRFGLEFDYRNADPSEPLECKASTSGGKKDFIGDLIAKGLEAMPEQEPAAEGEERHGMKELLGVFKKVVTSANSPEDVRISIAPLGPDGKPIESERVGSPADAGPQAIPRIVDITAPSGRLVVPMYQLVDGAQAGPLVHEIRCSHKGVPVAEATFRLSF